MITSYDMINAQNKVSDNQQTDTERRIAKNPSEYKLQCDQKLQLT